MLRGFLTGVVVGLATLEVATNNPVVRGSQLCNCLPLITFFLWLPRGSSATHRIRFLSGFVFSLFSGRELIVVIVFVEIQASVVK